MRDIIPWLVCCLLCALCAMSAVHQTLKSLQRHAVNFFEVLLHFSDLHEVLVRMSGCGFCLASWWDVGWIFTHIFVFCSTLTILSDKGLLFAELNEVHCGLLRCTVHCLTVMTVLVPCLVWL